MNPEERESNPPSLVAGRSARTWEILTFVAWAATLFGVFVIGGLIVGTVKRSPDEQARVGAIWIVLLALAITVWVEANLRLRAAAYREKAAGYTTLASESAGIFLVRGLTPLIRLFSTDDLWQLDAKTGTVIRPPVPPKR